MSWYHEELRFSGNQGGLPLIDELIDKRFPKDFSVQFLPEVNQERHREATSCQLSVT